MKSDRELLADALDMMRKQSRMYIEDFEIVREIRARLAEPEDEPIAYLCDTPLYLNEPGRIEKLPPHLPCQPVRLSDHDLNELWRSMKTPPCGIIGYKAIARQVMDAMLSAQTPPAAE